MSTAIKIENLSKQYRLGLVTTRTLSHDLNRWWQRNVLQKEDPYLKIGEVNDRTIKGESEYVWALRDINLEVSEGEVLGIIGKNGAGKSTLLKILSKVTSPTKGVVKVRGRIASLLEVGTGFHQEMTGRENIFMNGAIMGMTKREIRTKFDEIVDFAGVEKYIDTPVKRYSSGMMVRLGFAIAAHLEPEILVVDEVLAVGDAEFQNKCIGKMNDISKSNGRTILFVSHNMNAISKLCSKGFLIQNGELTKYGDIDFIINQYLNNSNSNKIDYKGIDLVNNHGRNKKHGSIAKKLTIYSKSLEATGKVQVGEDIVISIYFDDEQKNINLFQIGFENQAGERVMTIGSYQDPYFKFNKAGNCTTCKISDFNLSPGKYSLTIMLGTLIPFANSDVVYNACDIEIIDNDYFGVGKSILPSQGKLLKKSGWDLSNK